MTLSQEKLDELLKSRPFQYFSQVESTQDVARVWLQNGADSGAVVIADEQISGRGRKGRMWHTPPGEALAISVILSPSTGVVHQIMMLGALSIVSLLHDLNAPNVGIKWPNDVRLNGRKVCGVLPETIWQGGELEGVVLGLGLNVRVNFAGTELESSAISLESALGRSLDRGDLLVTLLEHLDYWTGHLGSPQLFEAWKDCLDTLGQHVDIGAIHGVAESVNPDGSLNIRDQGGQLQHVVAGDVTQ